MGRKRTIQVTESDMNRLEKLLEMLEDDPKVRDKDHLMLLDDELRRAKVVDSRNIAGDVITMNSRIRVRDLDTDKETVYQLVFPGEADVSQNKISILAPIGTALIGYRVGDTVQWKVPSGEKRLRVEEVVYQPEAAGDFHL